MASGITTSVRLSQELRLQLDHASQRLHRGRNWIINQAIAEYLAKLGENRIVNEARKQSIRASKADSDEIDIWHENQDDSGWK